MTDTNHCPNCGEGLPGDAPQGLCPSCLLRAAASPAAVASSPGPGFAPPPVSALEPLFPQYEMIELLGRGGMGAVYLARQRKLDRLVAIKILPPEMGADVGFAERFHREARTLGRLNHPGIVMVHDFGDVDGLFYLVMEYVDGRTLAEAMQTDHTATKAALEIVGQVMDALEFAHDEGVVHRDIKPGNILLESKTGRVRLADFGLSRMLVEDARDPSITGTRQAVGTPHYMAPEQFEHGAAPDKRADIYSVGVLLYELLTGRLPIGRFPPPSEVAGTNPRLDGPVLRCLSSDPDDRFRDVPALRRALTSGRPAAESRRSVADRRQPEESKGREQALLRIAITGAVMILVGFLPFWGMWTGWELNLHYGTTRIPGWLLFLDSIALGAFALCDLKQAWRPAFAVYFGMAVAGAVSLLIMLLVFAGHGGVQIGILAALGGFLVQLVSVIQLYPVGAHRAPQARKRARGKSRRRRDGKRRS